MNQDDNSSPPMERAIAIAEKAGAAGEVPVGAVIIDAQTGTLISAAGNLVETDSDPTAHAEILAIRAAAAKLGSARLTNCDLYVTLEPCAMCASAISHARIRRVVFGAYDPKGGGVEHGARVFERATCHHKPDIVGGVEEARCGDILRHFFSERR